MLRGFQARESDVRKYYNAYYGDCYTHNLSGHGHVTVKNTFGEVAEQFIAPVLKTGVGRPTASANLALTANLEGRVTIAVNAVWKAVPRESGS